jgi:hypothetical protein
MAVIEQMFGTPVMLATNLLNSSPAGEENAPKGDDLEALRHNCITNHVYKIALLLVEEGKRAAGP